jgi:hypothetical protein
MDLSVYLYLCLLAAVGVTAGRVADFPAAVITENPIVGYF